MRLYLNFFQKRYLRSFAQFIGSYESQKIELSPTDIALQKSTPAQIHTILENFYQRHNAEKVGEVGKILEMYQAKLPVMFETLENRYGVPAVTEEVDIEFGDGSLGLMIKEIPTGQTLPNGGQRSTTQIVKFNALADEMPNAKIQKDGLIEVGDIISKLNGEDVLWVPYKEVLGKIKASKRPLQITFMKPLKPKPPAKAGKYRNACGRL